MFKLKKLLLATAGVLAVGPLAQAAPTVSELTRLEQPLSPIYFNKQLLLTQQANGSIQSWNPTQEASLPLTQIANCAPSAMIPDKEGKLMLACTQNPRVLVLNSLGQVVSTFPRPLEERGLMKIDPSKNQNQDLSGITAMAQDARGGTYLAVTHSAAPSLSARDKGQIFYLSPSQTYVTLVADKLDYPAGLALSPDGNSLWVSEGLSRQVTRFDVKQTQLLNPQVAMQIDQLYQASDQALELPRPGALAFNSKGHLYVALQGEGRILVTNGSKNLAVLPLPAPYVTGFTFHAANDRILYVTASPQAATGRGGLYELRL